MPRALRSLFALWCALALTATPADAASPGRLLVTGGGAPGWTLPPVRGNGVDLNFATGQYWLKGATGPVQNSRATAETCFTSGGNLVQAGPYQNCVTDLGVGAWEGRTNSVPNNTSASGWSYLDIGGVVHSTPTVTTVNGYNVISTSYVGTPSASGTVEIVYTGASPVSVIDGQTWTLSESLSYSGSLTNISSLQTAAFWQTAGGTYISGSYASPSISTSLVRYQQSFVVSNSGANVASAINALLQFNFTSGQAVNVTFNIAVPQLELNPNIPASVASATTEQLVSSALANGSGSGYSNTSGTMTWNGSGCVVNPVLAVTYAAGVATVTGVNNGGTCASGNVMTAAAWTAGGGITGGSGFTATVTLTNFLGYGASQTGTLTWSGAGCSVNPVLNATSGGGGGLVSINSVVTPGSCTTFPTSAAVSTWTAGGGLTGSGSLGIALTPVNNSAQAFATTPILTTSGALARAPDNITLPVAACSGSGSLYGIGTPAAPPGYPQNQAFAQIDEGDSHNRVTFFRATSGYVVSNSTVAAVGVNVNASAAPVAAGVSGKTSVFATASMLQTVYNNGTINSGAVTGFPAGMTTLRIGVENGVQAPLNGTISRVAVACGQSLLNQ